MPGVVHSRRCSAGVPQVGTRDTDADGRRNHRLPGCRGRHQLRYRKRACAVRDQYGCGRTSPVAGQLTAATAGHQHSGEPMTGESTPSVRPGSRRAQLAELPIRRKLLLITLASSAAALAVASGGFLIWDVYQFSIEIRQDMQAQSRIVAESAAPAVEFDDPDVASATLSVLRLRPRVRVGCLYKPAGAVFAQYRQDQMENCPVRPPRVTALGWRDFGVVTSLVSGNDVVGTLFI